ncbi:MAG: lipopolysaccharide heptosyltransferase II [Candidatus Brocadiia bacterium]
MRDQRPTAMRICIRAPNWVGDVVMATPTFRAVRRSLPDAHVTLVIREPVEPIIRGSGWFDEVIAYDSGTGRVREFLRVVGRLRSETRDLGLLLPNSFSSALMFRLGGVRRRVGYKRDCRSILLTDALPRPSENGRFKPTYMVDYYLDLCRRVGIEPAGRHMELPFGSEDRRRADQRLRERGIGPEECLFLMHPGAGYGPAKRWRPQRFARLAEMLEEAHGARVAVIGGPAEKKTAADIVAGSRADVADLVDCGIDLHLLKPVVDGSALLVTTDSGPRHYGVALGVPTVCLMGPTHPGYSTSGWAHDHVVRADVECGPCQLKKCPRDHRCMEEITVERVFEACQDALGVEREPAHD